MDSLWINLLLLLLHLHTVVEMQQRNGNPKKYSFSLKMKKKNIEEMKLPNEIQVKKCLTKDAVISYNQLMNVYDNYGLRNLIAFS